MSTDEAKILLDAIAVAKAMRALTEMVHNEFQGANLEELALVGLQTRGAALAERLADALAELNGGHRPLTGALDISMYRDDIGLRENLTGIKETRIPFDVDGRRIVLVDDVLFTGRTIRAALDAVTDYGRPSLIRLAALVDRGHREFPIQADFAGARLDVPPELRVFVRVTELDGLDAVYSDTQKRRR